VAVVREVDTGEPNGAFQVVHTTTHADLSLSVVRHRRLNRTCRAGSKWVHFLVKSVLYSRSSREVAHTGAVDIAMQRVAVVRDIHTSIPRRTLKHGVATAVHKLVTSGLVGDVAGVMSWQVGGWFCAGMASGIMRMEGTH